MFAIIRDRQVKDMRQVGRNKYSLKVVRAMDHVPGFTRACPQIVRRRDDRRRLFATMFSDMDQDGAPASAEQAGVAGEGHWRFLEDGI